MSAATLAALIALITEAIKDAPEIISDIEALIGKAKATITPIEPAIANETNPLVQQIKQ